MSISPAQLQYQSQHIQDDRRGDIIGTAISMMILSTAAVSLRFACRHERKLGISHDDWLIVVALAFLIAIGCIGCYITRVGYGKHVIAVGPQNTETYLKFLLVEEVLYSPAINFMKLSVLALYRRIFPQEHMTPVWRTCWWIVFALIFAFLWTTIFGAVFQCLPVAFFWDRTIPGGRCFNILAFIRATGILNIVLDALVLALPVPVVWSLQLRLSKKLGVLGLFLLGGFVCITSICRFVFLQRFVAEDPTYSNVEGGIWSTVEPSAGIIGACLPILVPSLRARVERLSSTVFSSNRRSLNKISAGSSSSGGGNNSSGQHQRFPGTRSHGGGEKRPFEQFGVGKDGRNDSDVEMTAPIYVTNSVDVRMDDEEHDGSEGYTGVRKETGHTTRSFH